MPGPSAVAVCFALLAKISSPQQYIPIVSSKTLHCRVGCFGRVGIRHRVSGHRPKGPCTQIVYTLGPMYLYREYFKAKVYPIWVHGPLGPVNDRAANDSAGRLRRAGGPFANAYPF